MSPPLIRSFTTGVTMAKNDSHLDTGAAKRGSKASEPVTGPMRQRHLNALGKLTGQGESNPFGSDAPSTEKKVGNAPKTY